PAGVDGRRRHGGEGPANSLQPGMIVARRAAPRGGGIDLASGLVVVVALLGGGLLALSTLPSESLAGRLLGTTGEARAGPYTQELYQHIAERLRLSGGVLLALALALVRLRTVLRELLVDAVDATAGWVLRVPRLASVPRLAFDAWLVAALCVLALGLRIRSEERRVGRG